MQKTVVVAVPIYKQKLSQWERVSLEQLNRILGKYPKVFLAPESLAFDYGELGEGFSVLRFPKEHFSSVRAYSKWMLMPDLYQQLAPFRYMLLHQLDAFVFSDRLEEFCSMDYDYIGAPVFRFSPFWHAVQSRVGNGGFSLRKISSALRMIERFRPLDAVHPFAPLFQREEDVFWGFCGTDSGADFRTPAPKDALEFAVQDDVMRAYRRMPAWLPFGCHFWNQPGSIEFWADIISKQGYRLGEIPKQDLMSPREWHLMQYRKTKRFMNLHMLYADLRSGNGADALSRLFRWLLSYNDESPAWKDRMMDLSLLWRLCWRKRQREDNAVWRMTEQCLLEAIDCAAHADPESVGKCYDLLQGIPSQAAEHGTACAQRLNEKLLRFLFCLELGEQETDLALLLHGIEESSDRTAEACRRLWEYCQSRRVDAEQLLPLVPKVARQPQALLRTIADHANG